MATKLSEFTRAYLEAALWSSMDDDDAPLDENYDISDIHPSVLKALVNEAEDFEDEHWDLIEDDREQAGHDLWLTRNGHGAGFWDGDWPEPAATELTDAAKDMGEVDLYVGDDDMIYATGYERHAQNGHSDDGRAGILFTGRRR